MLEIVRATYCPSTIVAAPRVRNHVVLRSKDDMKGSIGGIGGRSGTLMDCGDVQTPFASQLERFHSSRSISTRSQGCSTTSRVSSSPIPMQNEDTSSTDW